MDVLRKEQKGTEAAEPQQEAATAKPRGGMLKKLLWFVVLVVVVGALIMWWRGGFAFSGKYQAVFLDNDQVYFGKISSSLNSPFVTLKEVFYLQINQDLQPVPEGAPTQPRFVLVKLGQQEIHGPKSEMLINRNHVLFIEDLRDDSQVVQGIAQFQESQNAAPAPAEGQ